MAFPVLGIPRPTFLDSNGDPLVSGTLEIDDPTTSSNKSTYPTAADADAASNANAADLTLNASGMPAVDIWGVNGEEYKITVKNAAGTTLNTYTHVAWDHGKSLSTDIQYAITAAETAAGITVGASDGQITNLEHPPYNILRYGADPSGGSDSAVAIQACINAVSHSDTKIVYIPGGRYKFYSTLYMYYDSEDNDNFNDETDDDGRKPATIWLQGEGQLVGADLKRYFRPGLNSKYGSLLDFVPNGNASADVAEHAISVAYGMVRTKMREQFITITNTDNTVTVNHPDHNAAVGDKVSFFDVNKTGVLDPGGSGSNFYIGNLLFANDTEYTITAVLADWAGYQFEHASAATSTVTAGYDLINEVTITLHFETGDGKDHHHDVGTHYPRGFEMRDLTLVGNTAGHLVHSVHCPEARIENCSFSNKHLHGSGVRLTDCHWLNISDCMFRNPTPETPGTSSTYPQGGAAIHIGMSPHAADGWTIRETVTHNWYDGLLWDSAGGTGTVRIQGGAFQGSARDNIRFAGTTLRTVSIDSVHFEGPPKADEVVTKHHIFSDVKIRELSVTNCSFIGGTSGGDDLVAYAYCVGDATDSPERTMIWLSEVDSIDFGNNIFMKPFINCLHINSLDNGVASGRVWNNVIHHTNADEIGSANTGLGEPITESPIVTDLKMITVGTGVRLPTLEGNSYTGMTTDLYDLGAADKISLFDYTKTDTYDHVDNVRDHSHWSFLRPNVYQAKRNAQTTFRSFGLGQPAILTQLNGNLGSDSNKTLLLHAESPNVVLVENTGNGDPDAYVIVRLPIPSHCVEGRIIIIKGFGGGPINITTSNSTYDDSKGYRIHVHTMCRTDQVGFDVGETCTFIYDRVQNISTGHASADGSAAVTGQWILLSRAISESNEAQT